MSKPTPNSSARSAISSAGRPSLKCFLAIIALGTLARNICRSSNSLAFISCSRGLSLAMPAPAECRVTGSGGPARRRPRAVPSRFCWTGQRLLGEPRWRLRSHRWLRGSWSESRSSFLSYLIFGLIAREPPGAEVECPADEQDAARKAEQIQSAFVAQSHGPSKELYGQRLLQCSKPHQEMPGIWRAIGG